MKPLLAILLLACPFIAHGQSLAITPSAPAEPSTQTMQLTAQFTDVNMQTSNVTAQATWTSATPSVASVQSVGQEFPGLMMANGPGTAVITATYQGVSCPVTATIAPNSSPLVLNVYPTTVTTALGTVQQFRSSESTTAQVTIEKTTLSQWKVSDTTLASISSTGLLTAIAPGTVTVTAKTGGLTGMATVIIPAVLSNTFRVPITDMTAAQNYLSYQGGLYAGVSNSLPTPHTTDGLLAAAGIVPLDVNGNPSPNGTIVMSSMGMSHVFYEDGYFVAAVDQPGSVMNYPTVIAVNGGGLSQTVCYWTFAYGVPNCPQGPTNNEYDRVLKRALQPDGLTNAQVQVLWVKQAEEYPAVEGQSSLCDPTVSGCLNNVPLTAYGGGCVPSSTAEACQYEGLLASALRAAKIRYPNLKLAFISSRSYAGYASTELNPEPYAYENGFAVKWIIQAQINQLATGQIDPLTGDLSYSQVPWIAWGPYLWTDGAQPRQDGLIWTILPNDDYEHDGTHPSDPYGRGQVTTLLENFFTSSPFTTWFVPAGRTRR